jgi:hypothetical protein
MNETTCDEILARIDSLRVMGAINEFWLREYDPGDPLGLCVLDNINAVRHARWLLSELLLLIEAEKIFEKQVPAITDALTRMATLTDHIPERPTMTKAFWQSEKPRIFARCQESLGFLDREGEVVDVEFDADGEPFPKMDFTDFLSVIEQTAEKFADKLVIKVENADEIEYAKTHRWPKGHKPSSEEYRLLRSDCAALIERNKQKSELALVWTAEALKVSHGVVRKLPEWQEYRVWLESAKAAISGDFAANASKLQECVKQATEQIRRGLGRKEYSEFKNSKGVESQEHRIDTIIYREHQAAKKRNEFEGRSPLDDLLGAAGDEEAYEKTVERIDDLAEKTAFDRRLAIEDGDANPDD